RWERGPPGGRLRVLLPALADVGERVRRLQRLAHPLCQARLGPSGRAARSGARRTRRAPRAPAPTSPVAAPAPSRGASPATPELVCALRAPAGEPPRARSAGPA